MLNEPSSATMTVVGFVGEVVKSALTMPWAKRRR
jgi:hypothetical protein